MLKGINRRIIEINRTDNDYFEKAILFVRSSKLGSEKELLSQQASEYLKSLPLPEKDRHLSKLKLLITVLFVFSLCLCAAGVVLTFF